MEQGRGPREGVAAEPTHRSSPAMEAPALRQPRQAEVQGPKEESVPGHQLRPLSQVQRKGVTRNTRRAAQYSELLLQPHPAKKLPMDEERMAEMRHELTGNIAGYLLEVANDLERIAATSGNLKVTYVRRALVPRNW